MGGGVKSAGKNGEQIHLKEGCFLSRQPRPPQNEKKKINPRYPLSPLA